MLGLGIREINLGMRNIQIAAPDDRLFLFELLEEFQEVLVPLLAIGKARQLALGIRGVNVDEKKVGVFRRQHASFLVVFGDAEMRRDFKWAFFREDARAGITLLLRRVPISRVVRGPELFDLIGRTFGFLQTQDVRLLRLEKFEKVLLQHGAQAVDVPGNEFHAEE